MSRCHEWISRLHAIRRTVAGSTKSHFDSRDIQGIFGIKIRAAQRLFGAMPTVKVGTSTLVAQEDLLRFLAEVWENGGPPQARAGVSKKCKVQKLRNFIPRHAEPVSLMALPPTIRLSPGSLQVSFVTVTELAESLYILARALDTDGAEFAAAYERKSIQPPTPERVEVDALFADLEREEAAFRLRTGG